KHLLKDADLFNTRYNYYPIGTGPFKFKEWGYDNTIILEANEEYFEARPYLDKIIVKSYPDSSELWSALMRGEVDFMKFMEQKDYEIAKQDLAFKTYAIPIDYYLAITYNLEDRILCDKRIRYAIAYAIDRKEMIRRIAGGYGIECIGPFYPESECFYEGIKPVDYNPEKAKSILSEAGWKDLDNNGILEKDGDDLELKILVDERSDVVKRIAMFIRQQLQEIGVKLSVILYNDEGQFNPEFLRIHNPQMHLIYGYADRLGSNEAGKDWCSDFKIKAGRLWKYRNREVDRLFALGQVTKDKEGSKRIYKKIHQLIYDDQPACFLFFPYIFLGTSAKFKNTEQFFSPIMPFYTIKDWYIEEVEN
ncbi:MAG: ABC transporter substrate-binding protein, partial [Candidatus Omnitrophota bacterium]